MNATPEEILAIVADTVVAVDTAVITGDTPLSAAGIDSLEMMNILLGVEEKYGIKIPDEDVDKLTTINAIVGYLQGL